MAGSFTHSLTGGRGLRAAPSLAGGVTGPFTDGGCGRPLHSPGVRAVPSLAGGAGGPFTGGGCDRPFHSRGGTTGP